MFMQKYANLHICKAFAGWGGKSWKMAERFQRLKALSQQSPVSAGGKASRRRIVAQVLCQNSPVDDEKVRKQIKELALRKHEQTQAIEQPIRFADAETSREMPNRTSNNQENLSSPEESEESEEDEEEPFEMLKPVFVPKEMRNSTKDEDVDWEAVEEARKRQAHLILAEYVMLEGIKATKKKEERMEATTGAFNPGFVDDTDDLDEAAEFQAWRLRELLRLKRDRQEREAREREQIELERLRNLTEAEKQELDRQKQAEWEAKPKTEYKFLQKYYHKGAFFGDLDKDLVERDFSQPTGSDRGNKELLPETMQVKEFGKKGRTKWTHLTNEDTTAFVDGWGDKKNPLNYRNVQKMGGMRGDLSRPSKRPKY